MASARVAPPPAFFGDARREADGSAAACDEAAGVNEEDSKDGEEENTEEEIMDVVLSVEVAKAEGTMRNDDTEDAREDEGGDIDDIDDALAYGANEFVISGKADEEEGLRMVSIRCDQSAGNKGLGPWPASPKADEYGEEYAAAAADDDEGSDSYPLEGEVPFSPSPISTFSVTCICCWCCCRCGCLTPRSSSMALTSRTVCAVHACARTNVEEPKDPLRVPAAWHRLIRHWDSSSNPSSNGLPNSSTAAAASGGDADAPTRVPPCEDGVARLNASKKSLFKSLSFP